MPLYTYRCEACQYQWDELRSISDRESPFKQPCPECEEKDNVRNVIAAVPGYMDAPAVPRGSKNALDKIERINKHHGTKSEFG